MTDKILFIMILFGAVLAICIAVFALISGRRVSKIHNSASTDPTTGGLNSFGLSEAAKKIFPNQTPLYSVVSVELSNWNQIIHTFGNEEAKKVLCHVEKCMRGVLGKAEPSARIGSNVFCLVMKNRLGSDIRVRLERISETANLFNKNGTSTFVLDFRFGIYIPDNPAEAFSAMVEKASSLFDDPENNEVFAFFEESAKTSAEKKWELVRQAEISLGGCDFTVSYQPKVALNDKRIIGAEAFVNWHHPKLGLLYPSMFLSDLDEYHFAHKLDTFVFENICNKQTEWKNAGLASCPVSMNISLDTVKKPGFAEEFADICGKIGAEAKFIEFELGEKIISEPAEFVHKIIDDIHSAGFRCAFDNFGKTAVSPEILRELNVVSVKLYPGFFSAENNDRSNRFIVEAIVKFASQMHITSVADGIENLSQMRYLQQSGCDAAQGFCFFKALSAEEFKNKAFREGELAYARAEHFEETPSEDEENGTFNGNIVMFTYSVEDDTVSFSDCFSPALRGQKNIKGAHSLFSVSELIHENDKRDFFRMLERCCVKDDWTENSLRFYLGENRYEWLDVYVHRASYQPGVSTVISGTLVNKAVWKKEVKHWQEKAHRDTLTGLYNREFFEREVTTRLENGEVSSGAVVFIDVNDFKTINDTLGHSVGDDVLCFDAKRLLGEFRHTDIVARYAGDEFVVFVNGISREYMEKRLAHLCDILRYPYRNGNVERVINLSMGATVIPDDGTDYLTLLKGADCAMYSVKFGETSRYAFYKEGMEMSKMKQKKRK